MIKVCKQHAILSSIVISILLVFFLRYIPWKDMFMQPYANWMAYMTRALVCTIFIGLFGIGKSAGFQKKGFGKSLFYGIPFYIIAIGSAVLSNLGVNFGSLQFVSWKSLLIFTLTIFWVSINEEMWLRAFILNLLSERFGSTKRNEWKAIIISALIFGGMHLVNLGHIDFTNVIVQIINACAGGILFGAIFIKLRNIWALIMIHFLVDWISLVIGECFVGTSTVLSVQMSPLVIVVTILGGVFVPVIFAGIIMKSSGES